MPPNILWDLASLDPNKILFDRDQIEKINPHRYEMRHLDGIYHLDTAEGIIVGFKEVTDQEFWIRGHIPGRPIMPGVIMVEAAAQLVSFAVKKINNDDRFIGFGGIDNVKFRGTVTPGCRLIMVGKLVENRPRRFICDTQGFVDDQMVFQARITGMAV